MLVTATIALLLGQRTLPARAPAQAKAPGIAVKRVTGAYFRMNDPAFVAQVLEDADKPAARGAAMAILPPELRASRAGARARLGAFRRGVGRGEVIVLKGGKAPGGGGKPWDAGANKIGTSPNVPVKDLMGYKDLVTLGVVKKASRSVGTVAQGSKPPTAVFQGTATKDGFLDVTGYPKAPFYIKKIRAETGEVEANGTPGGFDFGFLPGTKVPIKAGQDWTAEVWMQTETLGDQKTTLVIDDGAKNQFFVKGKVVPAKGELKFWTEKCFEQMAPGVIRKMSLHVRAEGTGSTVAQISGSSTLPGVTIEGLGSVKLDGSKEVIVPCTIKASVDALDGDGSLLFKASGYNGTATSEVEGLVQLKTVWYTTGTVTVGGGIASTASIFRYSNSGYWSVTSFQENTWNQAYKSYVGFMFDRHDKYNGNYGEYEHLGLLIGGSLAPKQKGIYELSGNDFRLRHPGYATSKVGSWAHFAIRKEDEPNQYYQFGSWMDPFTMSPMNSN